MKTPVTVLKPQNGNDIVKVIKKTDENGVEQVYGSFMVAQRTIGGFSKNSMGRGSRRIAYITLSWDNIEALSDYLVDGAEFPCQGKIVIEETLTPYIYKSGDKEGTKQEPKKYPKSHKKAGQVITYKGMPVYRNSYFTENLSEQDIFLKDIPTAEAEGTDSEE